MVRETGAVLCEAWIADGHLWRKTLSAEDGFMIEFQSHKTSNRYGDLRFDLGVFDSLDLLVLSLIGR
jgi:hypothetical protein